MRIWTTSLAALAAAAASVPAAAIDGGSVQRLGDGRMLVSWTSDEAVDVFIANGPDAELSAMELVSDDDKDGRHEQALDGPSRPYFLLRSEKDGAIVRVAERLLPLEGGSNFRDVGGYPAADGRRVRWGRIYRSGAMPKLTDRDYAYLSSLGIEVVCDLRSLEERQLSPTDAPRFDAVYEAVDYPAAEIFRDLPAPGEPIMPERRARIGNLYEQWPVSLAPQFRLIFEHLLAGEVPLAFNCSAGQDRTGVATALVLSALGVPRETILADYHLSTSFRRPDFEMVDEGLEESAKTNIVARYVLRMRAAGPQARAPRPLLDESGQPRLAATFAAIERRWGSVETYLDVQLGIDGADIARLRQLYTE